MRYQDYAITVFNEDDGKVIYWFPGIRLLRVYNPVEGYLDFSRSATRDGELRNFPGFGEGTLQRLSSFLDFMNRYM